MLNDITLQGRLVHTPELRYTKSEKAVASFSLACERDRKNADGDKETDFVECVAWNSTAKFIADYFGKGSLVVVQGRLQMRKWIDKGGNNRVTAEILVEDAYFCESKRKSEGSDNPPPLTDADAPPEVDHEGLAELAAAYPNNVQYADADEPLPWEM